MPLVSLDDEKETGTGASTLISTTATASVPNDLAVTLACGNSNSGGVIGQAPDASWTATPATEAFSKMIAAAGALTVSQPINSLYDTLQVLMLFKTIPGKIPVFVQRGTGSGGSLLQNPNAFTLGAGNSLLWLCNAGGSPGGGTSFQNAQGLAWSLLSNITRHSVDGGFDHYANLIAWYTENVPAQFIPAGGLQLNVSSGGTWELLEISNLVVGGLRLLLSLGVGI